MGELRRPPRTRPAVIVGLALALGAPAGGEQAEQSTVFSEHLVRSGYSYSYGLAAGDLDGDGDIDLTSSDTRNFKLYWLENDGTGTFSPHFVENGDRLDVIGEITSDTIDRSVLADKGSSLNRRWFTTPRLERHTLGDVNGDGRPDVVVVENLYGDLFWYKNSGTPADYPVWQRFTITRHTIPGAYDVAAADLDGDGDLDVAVSTWRLGNRFVWLENPGNPERAASWRLHVVDDQIAEPRTIRVGDFNGDGKPDLLGSALVADLVVWYENPGDPRTRPWARHVIDARSARPAHGMAADLDGDGDLDVVMALGMDAGAGTPGTREIVWYENLGSPGSGTGWQKHVIGADFDNAFEAVAVDLDGDGDLDVAATSWAAPNGRASGSRTPATRRGHGGCTCSRPTGRARTRSSRPTSMGTAGPTWWPAPRVS
jgi:hypothetical protein